MADRTIEESGARWRCELSGRRTQYNRDEVGVVFTSDADPVERRIARFSPQDVKSPEMAFAALTDRQLQDLLARSQPAFTSPELRYRR